MLAFLGPGAFAKQSGANLLRQQEAQIVAQYQQGSLYRNKSADWGPSPVGVRETRPVNVYIPPHQPMYDIKGRIITPPTANETQFIAWMRAHTQQKDSAFLQEKWQLAMAAIRNGELTHKRVLTAFLLTPREWFVRPRNLSNAYKNTPQPIGWGQTITDPETDIALTNALDPKPDQRVLEIGTGSGYQSAFLSELSNFVYTIEIVRPLGRETDQLYRLYTPLMPQYANIHRRLGDGYYGWPKYAPFDRIIVTTGIDHIPPVLLKELKPGGIMVIPVGPPTGESVLIVTKTVEPDGTVSIGRRILPGYARTVWVPFTAASGGTHNSDGRSPQ